MDSIFRVKFHRELSPKTTRSMTSDHLMNEADSDVVLKVRHESYSWRVPAHSLFLVNKSSIFQELLDERAEDDHPIPLTLFGVRPETAVAVLNYIYKDEYPHEVTADLLITSEKYGLLSLRDNLEEHFISDMTLTQACSMLEELQQRQPVNADCPIKSACHDLVSRHALPVFGSDLVLLFSKRTLIEILQSSQLNVPDDAFLFWGIWRWSKRECSKHDKSLENAGVASFSDDLIVLIRRCSVHNGKNIPSVASSRFDRCRGRRKLYCCPPDILKQSCSLRLSPNWDDMVTTKLNEEGEILCTQLSLEKDVLLTGITFEACPNEQNLKTKFDSYVRIIREVDRIELRRQRVCWCKSRLRKTSVQSDLEYRFESEMTLLEPLFLTPGYIYSFYLRGNFSTVSLTWSSVPKRRLRVNNTFVRIHSDGITSVREIHLIPDMSVTWGSRGPDV